MIKHHIISIISCGVFIFPVDASQAGAGEISVMVKVDNMRLAHKLVNKGGGHYRVYFMPKEPFRHIVFVYFSKENIPGKYIIL